MQREIGSNFWLNPCEKFREFPIGTPGQFNCNGLDYVWLSTGRSAIKYAIQTIEHNNPVLKKVAVLPSFTCNTVFEPFLNAGYDVYYYPIDKDLTTTANAILKAVEENDASVVLFHRYFGFDTLDAQISNLCENLKQQGKYTIEDCTQCLYSDINRTKADFTVGSIRKWTGTPDGGFIVSRYCCLENKPQRPDKVLEDAKVRASYAKYRFLVENQGDKATMLSMYRYAEVILDNQRELFTISEMSSKVQANLDVEGLKKKRRLNYNLLQDNLRAPVQPLFSLNEGKETPLYFPIIVEDRDALQRHLVQNAVYAPIVWPKDDKQPLVCEGAENAYNHLLCIPIDQRYDADDMYRIVDVINNYYK